MRKDFHYKVLQRILLLDLNKKRKLLILPIFHLLKQKTLFDIIVLPLKFERIKDLESYKNINFTLTENEAQLIKYYSRQ